MNHYDFCFVSHISRNSMYSFFTQENIVFFVLFVCNIEFVVSLKKTALKVFVLLLYACIFFSGESFRNQKTVRKIVAKYCPKIAVTFPTMQ